MSARDQNQGHLGHVSAGDGSGDSAVPAGALDPEPPERLLLELAYDGDDAFIAQWQAVGGIDQAIEACRRALMAHDFNALRQPVAVTVALSHNAAVQVLNRTFRGMDKPTNVLSFPAAAVPLVAQSADEPRPLGDVIVALETLLAEAAEQQIPPIHHLQHLVIHGVLHLLGFDHEVDAEAGAMEAIETAILARLGVPDPYAVPPG